MYEITGIIFFWVLRIGLFMLLLMLIQGCRIDRQNYTTKIPLNNGTWKTIILPWKRYFKYVKPQIIIFFIVLLLDIICWLTLFI